MKRTRLLFMLLLLTFIFTGCTNSKLPKEMPDDFTFSIKWGFDGNYDSATKILSNGYNYDLDIECKTNLELSKEQLQEIYKIIKKAKINTYDEEIKTKFGSQDPSSNLELTISFNEEKHHVVLLNSYLNDNMNLYLRGVEIGKAIKQIVETYITSSEEYKSLPKNQLLYD